MSSRAERMARNEVASREFNEEIEEAYEGEPPSNRLDIVCECALKMCDRTIDITMAEYRMVRSDPRQFAIVPEHLIGDIERIISENDRFAVVNQEGGDAGRGSDGAEPPRLVPQAFREDGSPRRREDSNLGECYP